MFRKAILPASLAAALLALAACGSSDDNNTSSTPTATQSIQDAAATTTPIKHLVVIFGENVSFDHYFGTYPNAQTGNGEPQFTPLANTKMPVNLLNPTDLPTPTDLTQTNPNQTNAQNTAAGLKPAVPTVAQLLPFRLDRTQANTASQNHSYGPEQLAEDNGLMDAFPAHTSATSTTGTTGPFATAAQVLGFFDGNTVTAMWNYANNFAMNDNAYTGTFGPSTPGAIEVISGQTNGLVLSTTRVNNTTSNGTPLPTPTTAPGNTVFDGQGGFTLIGDLDPAGDICTNEHAQSDPTKAATTVTTMSSANKNIGDLLNAKGLTWGGFMGGFDLTQTNPNGTQGCMRSTFSSVLNSSPTDYTQHHAWFQYYASTENPAHTRPTSTAMIGFTEPTLDNTATPVHHQYDTDDFFNAVKSGNFPSVSFLKAPAVQDAHPGNSDPLDEQAFVTKVLNFLQQQPDWKNTAVIITYDDSDGWYDHRFATPTSSSNDAAQDSLTPGAGQVTVAGAATGMCGGSAPKPAGVLGGAVNGRCGPGTRIPFVVVSPFAKTNFIDDTQITQASVIKFIEDNWLGGQRIGGGSFDATAGSIMAMFDFTKTTPNPALFLDPVTGTKLAAAPQD